MSADVTPVEELRDPLNTAGPANLVWERHKKKLERIAKDTDKFRRTLAENSYGRHANWVAPVETDGGINLLAHTYTEPMWAMSLSREEAAALGAELIRLSVVPGEDEK